MSIPRGTFLTLPPSLDSYIRQLLATGLYGKTPGDAALRLIERQLQELLKSHQLSPAELSDAAIRCPNCGSPKVKELGAMGAEELQCHDCMHIFKRPDED